MFDQPVDNYKVYDYLNIVAFGEKFGTLPQEGGLFAQDYLDIAYMSIILELQAERANREHEKAKRPR